MPPNISRSSRHSGHQGRPSSSSSHKHHSKTSSKSSTQLVKASNQDMYHQENKSLWKDVKVTEGNPSTLIVALVAPEQRRPMKKLIDDKIKKNKIRSPVVVTTQGQLQEQLQSAMDNSITIKKAFKTLHLLVSSTVTQLTYNIGGFVDQVFVKPCGSGGRQDALHITSSSTYCGFKSYAWSVRPQELQQKKQLTHHEGCFMDIRDCQDEAISFLQQPRMTADLSEDEKTNIMQQFNALGKTEVSNNTRESSIPHADGTETWFQKWKSLLATVMAAGAGAAGMAGGFWISAGGIMVKGPCGLYMAAGYATVGAAGVAGAAGAGSAIIAYGAVYLIPWDQVWDLLRAKLWQIWESIWEALVWIKDKLAQLASTVLTKVSWLAQDTPKSIRLSI